uniref:glucosaminidase domain-containing protein n=1 Tax=Anaerococcus mediterraneensis TaxID=1870984 RepID=UPI000930B274|nr:glucosaminidase domain-containing protein [Anaerococcus mediterraneensis]
MKKLKYIIASVAIFAALISNSSADELINENEIVYYDSTNLDDLLIKPSEIDLNNYEETKLEATNYKDSNQVNVEEKSVEEESKEEDIHKDIVEIKGSTKNANGTETEPGTVRFTNYYYGVLSNFDIRTKNPDHIDGAYIDRFLEKRGHYSALKGYGDTILKYSNKYGINVGVFMGQIAKETTFGMNPAGGKYNFGSVRYFKNGAGSQYPPAYARGLAWINPPTVEEGIEVLFKLMRENYADKGYVTYKSFLNRYAPSVENNHASFEKLAAGTMNALMIAY